MFGCGVQSFPPHAAKKRKRHPCNSTAGMRVDPLNVKPFRCVIIRSSKSAFFWLHLESLAEASFYAELKQLCRILAHMGLHRIRSMP